MPFFVCIYEENENEEKKTQRSQKTHQNSFPIAMNNVFVCNYSV